MKSLSQTNAKLQLAALSAVAALTLTATGAWAQSSSLGTSQVNSAKKAAATKKAASTATSATASAAAPSTTAPATTGTSTASASKNSVLNNFIAAYSGSFSGPSVVNPLETSTPDMAKDESTSANRLKFEHALMVGYKLTDRVTLKVADSVVQQIANTPSISNPSIRASMSKLGSIGPVSASGELRYYIPAKENFVNNFGTVQARQALSASFGKSRFSSSMLIKETASILPDYKGKTTLSLYAGPQIEYQISPKVQFWGLLEAGADHTAGKGLTAQVDDFEPGLSIDITPSVNFSPYLDIPVASGVSLNKTSINALISWSIL